VLIFLCVQYVAVPGIPVVGCVEVDISLRACRRDEAYNPVIELNADHFYDHYAT
jgi:hypothetical protein